MSGFVAGALMYLLLALVSIILSMVPPTNQWIVQREELYSTFCWKGAGIWNTELQWGEDLNAFLGFLPRYKCDNDMLGKDALDLYCNYDPNEIPESGDKDFTTKFYDFMCSVVWPIRSLGIASLVFCLITFIYIIKCIRADLILKPSNIRAAIFFALITSVCAAIPFLKISFSMLFEVETLRYLGSSNKVEFDGFGCKFQSPFVGGLFEIVKSMPLLCIFPGFGYSLTCVVFLASLFCAGLLYGYLREINKIIYHKRQLLINQSENPFFDDEDNEDGLHRAEESTENENPLLDPNYNGVLRQLGVVYSNEVVTIPKHGARIQIPEELLFPRRYSLFGATIRRSKQFPQYEQVIIALILPMLAIGNMVLFAWWSMYGIQYVVDVNVGDVLTSPSSIIQQSPILECPSDLNNIDEIDTKAFVAHLLNRDFDKIELMLGSIFENMSFADLDNVNFGITLPKTFLKITEQVFDFDPINSVRQFWVGGARFISLITAVWLDFFPFIKVVAWLILWFVPMGEVIRGRILTWMDALGKWSFANLFAFCLMHVAFIFDARIDIPIPIVYKKGHAVGVHIRVGAVESEGTTQMLVALFWSIILGSLFLELHTRARKWEEVRRDNYYKRMKQTQGLTESNALDDDSLYNEQDTPYIDGMNSNNEAVYHSNASDDANNNEHNSSALAMRNRGASIFFVRKNSSFLYNKFLGDNNTKDKTSSSFKESLLNRTYRPVKNKHHKFSVFGKLILNCSLIMLLVLTVVSFFLPVIDFNRHGFLGQVLVKKEHRLDEYSLVSLVPAIDACGVPSFAMSFLFFSMIIPTIRVTGLLLMWNVSLTRKRQLQLFRFMELIEAWSAIDVLCVSLFVSWYDIDDISRRIVGVVVPGLNDMVVTLFPSVEGLYIISSSLHYGIYLLLFSAILEKILSYITLQTSLLALTERAVEQKYQAATRGRRNRGGTLSTGSVTTNSTPSLLNQTIYEDQRASEFADDLLQNHQTLGMFSPAGRYFTVASNTDSFYSGLPRFFWRFCISLGLLREKKSILLNPPPVDIAFELNQNS